MKFKFETIISFVLQALFYSVGIYLAFALLDPSLWNIKSLLYSFFPISRNIWWFLTAYLALYFVSPFLNKGIDSVEHSQLTIILVGFLFLDCFSGFFFGTLSETGYTFFHLFTLYILARYINKYLPRIKKASFLFVVSTVILFGSTLALLYLKELSGVWKMFSYNNPIVITSSVLFFFMFKSINFKSKIVNLLSGSVFGVYLFHDHYLTREAIAHIVNQLQYNYSGIKFVSFIFLITVSIFVFGITVELIRKSIFDKLIDKALNIWKTNRWVANKKLQIFGNNGS
jgi:surface polysaccharide O-acyltransferase-like enzyme